MKKKGAAYIQFADAEGLEEYVDGEKVTAAFCSPDHRAYQTITLSDADSYTDIDAETLNALYQLQTHLEMMEHGTFENPMGKIANQAVALDEQWNKTMAAVKFQPMRKRPR